MEGKISEITIEPEIRSRRSSRTQLIVSDTSRFLFNLKITDLSRLDNPYVIFENKRIDSDGYLMFDESHKFISILNQNS